MEDVVIVSACRTAIGAFGGSLKDLGGSWLASVTMREAVNRAGIDPQLIDDVRYGCCMEHHDTLNVSRVAALKAGIPEAVTAATVNRACISGMEATVSGMAMIQAGMADVILAGGVEHMSSIPFALPGARWGYRLQDQTVEDALIHALHAGSHELPLTEDAPLDTTRPPAGDFLGHPYIMGHTAEFVADKYGISRQEMDEVALRSRPATALPASSALPPPIATTTWMSASRCAATIRSTSCGEGSPLMLTCDQRMPCSASAEESVGQWVESRKARCPVTSSMRVP